MSAPTEQRRSFVGSAAIASHSVERANERDDRIRAEHARKDEAARKTLRAGALSWQIAVNSILLAAGYHSGEFGLLSKADMVRMDAAFAAGDSPEQFATSVLDGAR